MLKFARKFWEICKVLRKFEKIFGEFWIFFKFLNFLGNFFWNFLNFLGIFWRFFWILFNFFQNLGEILNLFGNFKICWKNLNFWGNFEFVWILEFLKNLKHCHFELSLESEKSKKKNLRYTLNLWILRLLAKAQYDKI